MKRRTPNYEAQRKFLTDVFRDLRNDTRFANAALVVFVESNLSSVQSSEIETCVKTLTTERGRTHWFVHEPRKTKAADGSTELEGVHTDNESKRLGCELIKDYLDRQMIHIDAHPIGREASNSAFELLVTQLKDKHMVPNARGTSFLISGKNGANDDLAMALIIVLSKKYMVAKVGFSQLRTLANAGYDDFFHAGIASTAAASARI